MPLNKTTSVIGMTHSKSKDRGRESSTDESQHRESRMSYKDFQDATGKFLDRGIELHDWGPATQ